jgi:hypothetical protein
MTARVEMSVPLVDDERIQDTYEELKGMQLELDPDPIEYGPRRFNTRIAAVRSMLNRVEQLSLQASEDLHYFKRIINAKKGIYELEKRELMVKDPTCRVGRSQGEREALADVRLRAQIEEIQELEASAHDLETLMLSIRSKRTDLKDGQSRMRDQMKMIEHDISMGARWGNRDAPSLSAVAGSAGEDLDTLLAKVDTTLGWEGDEPRKLLSGSEDLAEEEEEEEDEKPSVTKPSVTKPSVTKPSASILVLEGPVGSEVAEQGEDDVPRRLEAAFGEGRGAQFGDDALTAMAEVDSLLDEIGTLPSTPVESFSPNNSIDDLIASLVSD